MVEPAMRADLLGNAGEPHQPPRDPPGEQPTQGRSDDQHGQADPRDLVRHPTQHAAGLVDVYGHLQRPAPVAESGDQFAVAVASHHDLRGERPSSHCGGRQGAYVVRDRQRHRPAAHRDGPAVGGHGLRDQLPAAVASTLPVPVPVPVAAAPPVRPLVRPGVVQDVLLAVRQGCGDRAQRPVDLRGDALRGGVIAERPDHAGDDRADQCEGQREARASSSLPHGVPHAANPGWYRGHGGRDPARSAPRREIIALRKELDWGGHEAGPRRRLETKLTGPESFMC
jgi:hypothetical protein